MTDREKLIKLIQTSPADIMGNHGIGNMADHLITNGVTVQQWIPVTERLPENDTTVLVYRPTMAIKIMQSYYYNRFCDGALNLYGDEVITHWMPLPEGPKEEHK